MPIISSLSFAAVKSDHPRPEATFYILSRHRAPRWCLHPAGFALPGSPGYAEGILKLQVKLQPLDPKDLRSSFPPSYFRTPISIGINHRLLKDPTTPSSS